MNATEGSLPDAVRALDAEGVKRALATGVDVALVDRAVGGLVHLALASLEDQARALTHARTARSFAAGATQACPEQARADEAPLLERAVATVRALLRRAADLDLVTARQGLPPLHLAAHLGATPVLNDLVRHGVDVNQRTRMGNTALHQAASQGQLGCMRRLAKLGVDVNAVNQEGRTAAHLAATNEHVLALRELKRLGAGFHHVSAAGHTAPQVLGQRSEMLLHQWDTWERRYEAQIHAQRLDRRLDAPVETAPRRPRF